MSGAGEPTGKAAVAVTAAVILFMALVSLAYFGPFLHNFFVADDFFLLERIIQDTQTMLIGYNSNLRIMHSLLWRLMMACSDLSPVGYNLFGLLLYFLNGLLVYLLLGRLLKNRLLAVCASCFFIAAAVGADAVFWRAAYSTLINLLFYLLTLNAYVLYRQRGQRTYLLCALAFFLCAMISKEEAASLPFMLVMMELLVFPARGTLRQIARRVAPFVAVIALYLFANHVLLALLFNSKPEILAVVTFRPLYTLLGGWTVFFIGPQGRLLPDNPMIYITALAIPASFFLVRERRLLLFGYGWIFCAFLPQSLSGLSQFRGDMLVNSLSRHLYLPSIGASLVLALLLVSLRERLPSRLFAVISVVVMVAYCGVNYQRVQERGKVWQAEGEHVARFVRDIKRILPQIPENSYVTVSKPPEGRAFIQAALRAFYHNPKIYWKDSYQELKSLPHGAYGIYVDYDWEKNWWNSAGGKAYIVTAPANSIFR